MSSKVEKRGLLDLAEGVRGTAMTETALLCFFIYAPLLMMVIVWGDLTLDKEQAHVAAHYMTFSPQRIEQDVLADRFFPGATGQSDSAHSVRKVEVLRDDLSAAPQYTVVGTSAVNQEMDIQAKLFRMALGEMTSTLEWVSGPGGSWELVPVLRTQTDQVARYLLNNGIVRQFDLPAQIIAELGQAVSLATGAGAASRPTEYALAVTDILNGEWYPGAHALHLSEAGIRTRFRSDYLGELGSYSYGERQYDFDLPADQGRPGVSMEFGRHGGEPRDSTFRTGFSYLLNPDGLPGRPGVPDAGSVPEDLQQLSEDLFTFQGGQGVLRMEELAQELPVMTEYPSHELYLEPGPLR